MVSYAGHPLPGQSLARVRAGGENRPVVFVAARGVLTAGTPEIALELSGTVPLVDAHYDLMDNGEQRAEITAWRVQPGVALEVSWQGYRAALWLLDRSILLACDTSKVAS